MKVAVEDGNLRIVQEGRNKKFVRLIEQITFSGPYASQRSQPVLYVTERCVLQLTPKGLELIEIAPGIDLQRDILDQMEFKPIIENVTQMDPRIFRCDTMGLLNDLLNLNLSERVTYDAARHTMFLNLEGWSVKKKRDIEDLNRVLQEAFAKSGPDVNMVMNQNGFRIAEDLQDDYAAAVGHTLEKNSASVAHYTTSAFMRLKMQGELASRGVSHISSKAARKHIRLSGAPETLSQLHQTSCL